jgi:phosphate/sulfate permease
VLRAILLAWVVTVPGAAALGLVAYGAGRLLLS